MQTVTITWHGEPYEVPRASIMGLLAAIEQHITLFEISDAIQAGTFKISQLSAAWSAALSFVGIKADPLELLQEMGEPERLAEITSCLSQLLMLMVPPEQVQKQLKARAGKKKPKAKPRSS